MARKGRARVVIKAKKKQARSAAQEVSALGRAIRTLGMAAGGAAGGYLGNPAAGGAVGHTLGAALSRWLGAGDYTIGSNTVVKQSMKAASAVPAMHSDQQSVIIRHKEYLGEVLSSTSYTVQQSYPLNPGNATTFPWLSNIAASFQEYRIRGMVFHYIPSSGSAVSSTNAALGTVMIQTSYRSNDATPSSKVELLNEFWSNEVVPSDTMAHPIECDPKENPFNVQYIRTGSVPAGDSVLMYDLGLTHLAVSGCQSTGNRLGDLWVTYDIELKKPLLYSNVTSRVDSSTGYVTTGLSTTTLFGTTTTTLGGSTPVSVLNNSITFPKGMVGRFVALVEWTGNTLAITDVNFTLVNCASTPVFDGLPTAAFRNLGAATINTVWIGVSITDPAVNPVVTLALTGSATAITLTRVVVSQLS